MESNHHGCCHPQGPQPCASTSSATAACGRSILDKSRTGGGGRARPSLRRSGRIGTLRTSVRTSSTCGWSMDLDLTKRQKEIFDFIRRYAAKTGYPPTVREIGKAVGLHSSSTVHAHLANLEKIGLLRRDPSK